MLSVAVIGAGDLAYPRHAILLEGLQAQGVDVRRFVQPKRTPTRQRWAYLWHNFADIAQADVVLLLAFNQTSVPLARFLAWRYGVPLVVDYLTGLGDVADDRAVPPTQLRLYQMLDRWNLQHEHLLTDTPQHITYYAQTLNITPLKMHALPVGARSGFLEADLAPAPDDVFTVQYMGTFIPFHGVETILEVAHLLRDATHIRFELIGEGQTLGAMQELAQSLQLERVRFITGYHRPPDVYDLLAKAHVFLGVLGASPKTDYVVPTKIYELMALRRPLITAQSSALMDVFTPDEHLLTVPASDAQALANAIQRLAQNANLRAMLAQNAYAHLQAHYTPAHIGAQLVEILQDIITPSPKTPSPL
jgi:glycosyltransferase involved in cell wall biosynthesis